MPNYEILDRQKANSKNEFVCCIITSPLIQAVLMIDIQTSQTTLDSIEYIGEMIASI